MQPVFVVGAKRTAIGSFLGSLQPLSAPQLGARAIHAAVAQSGVVGEQVGQVFMGNVVTAGVGQAPARQATLGSGLPNTVGAVTLNKVCGSGLMAVHLASQAVRLGEMEFAIAGGMESMSNAPMVLPGVRQGVRLGHSTVIDSVVHDGLWDVYNDFHMGSAAELCARERNITREDQDAFAVESYRRANHAHTQGWFADEITALEVPAGKKGTLTFDADEEPQRFKPEKIATLRPAFDKAGTVTAANASSLSDGAAALVLASEPAAKRLGSPVLGCIVGFAKAAMAPEWFSVAPVLAIKRLLEEAKLTTADIDLFEINEAFSVVTLAANRELELDAERVNVHGGAVAIGHPIGASGARILVTLLHAMERRNAKRGVAAICIGGGEAVAMLVER